MPANRPFRQSAVLTGFAFLGMSGLIALHALRGPASPAQTLPGLTYEQDGRALVVTSVQTSSAAQMSGIRVGDTIQEVNGQTVESGRDIVRAESLRTAATIKLRLRRDAAIIERDLPASPQSAISF
ncbi:MAG: hypothetical protein RL367_1523 [Pseudomonadota bacterium]